MPGCEIQFSTLDEPGDGYGTKSAKRDGHGGCLSVFGSSGHAGAASEVEAESIRFGLVQPFLLMVSGCGQGEEAVREYEGGTGAAVDPWPVFFFL